MANAIKRISVARGHDVTRYTLVCFGGAAGQHACLVADALAMDTVMIHPLASVLSALGMGLADRRVLRERSLALPLTADDLPALNAAVAALAAEARAALVAQDIGAAAVSTESRAYLRYRGHRQHDRSGGGGARRPCSATSRRSTWRASALPTDARADRGDDPGGSHCGRRCLDRAAR